MIRGFEVITEELTENELKNILPEVVRGLKSKKGKSNAVPNKKIVSGLKNIGIVTTEPRIRKIINYIRRHGLVHLLMATSLGYYVSENEDEIREYINSLRERENAIKAVRESVEYQLEIHTIKF
jgi:hypothetical protein